MVLLLVLGVAGSVGGWRYASLVEERRIEGAFRQRATVQLGLAHERLQRYADALGSVRSFFEYSATVDREEFTAFARPILERIPSARMLEWTPRVPHEQREVFEKRRNSPCPVSLSGNAPNPVAVPPPAFPRRNDRNIGRFIGSSRY